MFTFWGCTITRDPSFSLDSSKREYPVDLRIAEVDALGNVITLSKNNTITRFNKLNNSSVQYSDNRLGKIDVMDTRNPIELLVFFRSYGIVKWLDNSLSVIEEVNLQNSNIVNVCSSNDGNFWIFDENTQRIYKKNRRLVTLIESNRMSDLGIDKLKIYKMRESNNRLVVLAEGYGYLIFDNFGQFQRKISSYSDNDFQLLDQLLIEFKESTIKLTDLSQPFAAPKNEIIAQAMDAFGLRIWEKNYFLLFNGGIDVIRR